MGKFDILIISTLAVWLWVRPLIPPIENIPVDDLRLTRDRADHILQGTITRNEDKNFFLKRVCGRRI